MDDEINDFKEYINNIYDRISQNTTNEIFIYNNIDELKIFCNKYKIRLIIYNNDEEEIRPKKIVKSKIKSSNKLEDLFKKMKSNRNLKKK